jgi:ferredoxin, 2Fe-2S
MSLFGKKEKETAAVNYISHTGAAQQVLVPVGDSVMEGAISNGIDGIVAECGGACQCGTCHVYVDENFLDRLKPIQENEDEMLNTTFCPRRPNSRLSCQIPVTKELNGLIVRTPEAQQ